MPASQSGADRAAGVACGRLNPNPIDSSIANDLAVGDTVERHAAGETQVADAVLAHQRPRQSEHHVIGDRLDRGGDVHMEGGELLVGTAYRLAKKLGKTIIGHGQTGAIIEIRLIEPERTVGLEVDEIREDHILETRLAVRREPHHFVFAGIDLEAGVVGEGRI